MMAAKHEAVRTRALEDLRRSDVVMDGHFDYGNGFHGRLYLNPHQLFRTPSTIWRAAQDLIDLMPASLADAEVIAGPVTGGALLAHTLAGLLDGRRPLTHPPCTFAPFGVAADGAPMLTAFYASLLRGRRVLLADDVRNTGLTFTRCAALVAEAGGTVIGTVEIVDRLEAVATLDVPNIALIEYVSPPNYPATTCPLCAAGVAITAF